MGKNQNLVTFVDKAVENRHSCTLVIGVENSKTFVRENLVIFSLNKSAFTYKARTISPRNIFSRTNCQKKYIELFNKVLDLTD